MDSEHPVPYFEYFWSTKEKLPAVQPYCLSVISVQAVCELRRQSVCLGCRSPADTVVKDEQDPTCDVEDPNPTERQQLDHHDTRIKGYHEKQGLLGITYKVARQVWCLFIPRPISNLARQR